MTKSNKEKKIKEICFLISHLEKQQAFCGIDHSVEIKDLNKELKKLSGNEKMCPEP